ncbi:MAG: hypothetical protein R2853_11720 [Thermomicrobiales bacterium]
MSEANDACGLTGSWRSGGAPGNGDDVHPGGKCRFHACWSVFEDDALLRLHPQSFGGQKERVGVRFATDNFIAGHFDVEAASQPRFPEDGITA